MSVKNIKIATASLFIALTLLSVHMYVKKSVMEFTEELKRDTQSIRSTSNVKPVFYSLDISKKARSKSLKVEDKKIYTLELGLTSSLSEAKSMVVKFKKRKIDTYYTPLNQSGKTYFILRHGLFKSKATALKSQKILKERDINSKVKVL